MRLKRESNGQPFTLTEQELLGAGGEARIYRIPQEPTLVAKVWHQPTQERGRKLRAMLANPPSDPTADQSHISIAWPTDMILTTEPKPRPVGFTMAYVSAMTPVIDFFNPKTRRQKCPLFNYVYLMRTARNLAIAVRALHEKGYVIGDMNESNILVSETALVTIVDTDSFQVRDPENGVTYRCRVGKPEFTPPEIQGMRFAQFDREQRHDLFGLGIILFQLLMEGTHPFAGTFRGQGEPPPYEERISRGHFPHGNDPSVPYGPKPVAPPFQSLPPPLQHLFVRCFLDGHRDPALRPDAQSWQWGLEEVEKSLIGCHANAQHVYGNHLGKCPWCERTEILGGRDPFPSAQAVGKGIHLRPAKRPRTVPQPRPPSPAPPPPQPLYAPQGGSPPVPVRIPVSSTGGGRRPARSLRTKTNYSKPPFYWPQPRNDWAWMALIFAILSLGSWFLVAAWSGLFSVFVFGFGMLATICGLYGEFQSRGWELDGKGSGMARVAVAAGMLNVAAFAFYIANLKPLSGGL